MEKFIVLLRGINVGGNNILPMKDLKKLLTDSGYAEVQTYIQSGNIVLSAAKLVSDEIEDLIEKQFGFRPAALVLNEPNFKHAAVNNPFKEQDGKTVHFYFCSGLPTPNSDRLTDLKTESEQYQIIDQVFYLHAPDGIGRSKLAAKAESCLGVSATARNLNTVNKLLTMLSA